MSGIPMRTRFERLNRRMTSLEKWCHEVGCRLTVTEEILRLVAKENGVHYVMCDPEHAAVVSGILSQTNSTGTWDSRVAEGARQAAALGPSEAKLWAEIFGPHYH